MTGCERLAWDSEFFGISIARIQANHLTDADAREAIAWCTANGIACLYFLADADDPATIRAVEMHEFRMVDIRVTLDCSAPLTEGRSPAVRPYGEYDLAQLRETAREGHANTRFYSDPGFDRSRCADLYAAWIERSCRGWAQAVFVAEDDGAPAGYITCHRSGACASIGLLAVDERSRGKGLGTQLVQACLSYLRMNAVQSVTVVTQGGNIDSQRLYQAAGFRTRSVGIWYHRWFAGASIA
jgi:ribosomal protein S18 acetylase RimI-like enzyme